MNRPALRLLDRLIERAHMLRIGRRRLHPYFLLADLGLLVTVVFCALKAATDPEVRLVPFLAVLAGVYASYEGVFIRLKAKFLGTRARSLLQDVLLFILPSFLTGFAVLGLSWRPHLDLLAQALPLFLAFVRVGCFLGGCCYGRPCRWGCLYPPHVHAPAPGGCRAFQPGPPPEGRVFPIQLLDSVTQLTLFLLLQLPALDAAFAGRRLLLYLVGYAAFRMVSDCWRKVSARPRIGPFSEAQVVSGLVVLAGFVLLIL